MIRLRPSNTFDRLNAEQRQSLDWTRSISIRANAGSGKTSVLIQRIIQILHNAFQNGDNLRLDHIVAITFTRKAAAQLRQKLRDALTICDQESTGIEQVFWQTRLDELPTCPIGTIDSVCHRILHAAINDGMIDDLDPNFGILQGIDRWELLDRAIERTEQFIVADPAAREAWLSWLTTQGRSEINGALRRLLGSPVSPDECMRAFEARAKMSEEDVLRLIAIPAITKWNDDSPKLPRQVLSALNEIATHPKGKKPTDTIQGVIDFLNEFLNNPPLSPFDGLCRLQSQLYTGKGEIWSKGLTESKTKAPYFQGLHDIQAEWHACLKNWDFEPCNLDGLELSRRLILIYQQAHQHFRDLCNEENRYDFNYLAERSIAVLNHPTQAARLTGHYRYVLVDEFQDTNELHWQIVARVAGEDPTQPVKSSKLMIVGDPQQSIYRFRQADPTVFSRVIELIKRGNICQKRQTQPTAYDQHQETNGLKTDLSSDGQRLGEMKLAKNYRSRDPLPIKLLDKLSQHAFDQVGFDYQKLEAGNSEKGDFTEVVYLVPSEPDADQVDEPAEDNDEPKTEPSLSEKQVRLVAGELRRLHGDHGFKWKEMAVLLRSRGTHIQSLEKVFRESGIPYQLLGGLGFWQRQEVRDLVSLAQCLANGSDDLALFAVLRGPLIGLDDSELLFLATLGGRHLGKGLNNLEKLLAEDESWSSSLDESTAAALKQAWTQIGDDRRCVLRIASQRLGSQGTWRQRVDRMPHAELMRFALDESHAWAAYATGEEGDRSLANLRLLLDEVGTLEADRPGSLAETARRLKLLVDEVDDEEQAELDAPAGNAVQIMTVHAAKGLQFPVVAVVGLERPFRPDHADVWLLDRFQHLDPKCRDTELAKQLHGLPIIKFLDPEKPLETVRPLLHQAIGSVEKRLTIAEEARIFHVAITRAERVLLLSGAIKWKSNSWQRWVHEALGLDENPTEGLHQVDGLTIRVVRNPNDIAPTETAAEQLAPVLDLTPMPEAPRRRTIAATSLFKMIEQYEKDPNEWRIRYQHYVQPRVGPLPSALLGETSTKNEIGWLIGTLVHRALEMGDAFPKEKRNQRQFLMSQASALTRTTSNNLDELGSNTEDMAGASLETAVTAANQILAKVLPNNPFKGLLDTPGDSEVDFNLKLGDWTILGRFDRLIRNANGHWEIVDWKTEEKPIKEIVELYRNQMKLYALALFRSLGEKERPASIVVHLAMTKHQKTELLEFSAAELESFEHELLSRLPALT